MHKLDSARSARPSAHDDDLPPGVRAASLSEIVIPQFEPTRYGEYVLQDRIGSGGMAEIFLATSQGIEGFEKRLVIKRILPTLSDDEQFVRMFIEEAKLCVALKHPNIVQVYDLGEIDHQYFIAMEYVDGRDLLKTLAACGRNQIGFPTDIALYIVMEVLRGLSHAHELRNPSGQPLGIIHRDVSPSNVLLSFSGEVKIGDFGIAKASTREKTATGILKGKFGYMAPEQVVGAPIDHRADVFAAGIVLFELLTGRRLFSGKNDLAVLERVRDAHIDPMPRTVRPDLAPELERIVLEALAKDPGVRFQTAQALHDALQDYVYACKARVGPAHLAQFMQGLFLKDPEEQARRARAKLPPVEAPSARAFGGIPERAEERTSVSVVMPAAFPTPEEDEDEEPEEVTTLGLAPQRDVTRNGRRTPTPQRTPNAERGFSPAEIVERAAPEAASPDATVMDPPHPDATLIDGDATLTGLAEEDRLALYEKMRDDAPAGRDASRTDVYGDEGPPDLVTALLPEDELDAVREALEPEVLAPIDGAGATDTFEGLPDHLVEAVDPELTDGGVGFADPADRSHSWAELVEPRCPSAPRSKVLIDDSRTESGRPPSDGGAPLESGHAGQIADAMTMGLDGDALVLEPEHPRPSELRDASRISADPTDQASLIDDSRTESGALPSRSDRDALEETPLGARPRREIPDDAATDGRPDAPRPTRFRTGLDDALTERGDDRLRADSEMSTTAQPVPDSGEVPWPAASLSDVPEASATAPGSSLEPLPRVVPAEGRERSVAERWATTFGELIDEDDDDDATVGLPELATGDVSEFASGYRASARLDHAGRLDDEGADELFGVLSVLDDDEASSASFGMDELSGETESKGHGLPEPMHADPSVEYGETHLGALTHERAPAYKDPSLGRPPSLQPVDDRAPRRGPKEMPRSAATGRPLFDLGVAPEPAPRAETMDELEEPSGLVAAGFAEGSAPGFALEPADDPTSENDDFDAIAPVRRAPERLVSDSFDLHADPDDPFAGVDRRAPTAFSGPTAADRHKDALRRVVERIRPAKEMNRARHVDAHTGAIDLPPKPAPVPAPVPTHLPPPPPESTRTKWLWAVVAIFMLAAGGGTLAWALSLEPGSAAKEPTALAPLPPEPDDAYEALPEEVPAAAPSEAAPASKSETDEAVAERPSNAEEAPIAAPVPPEEKPGAAPAPAQVEEKPAPTPAARPRSASRRANRSKRASRKPKAAKASGGTLYLSCRTPTQMHIRGRGQVAVPAGELEHGLPAGSYVVTLVRDGRILDRRAVRLLEGSTVDLPCP